MSARGPKKKNPRSAWRRPSGSVDRDDVIIAQQKQRIETLEQTVSGMWPSISVAGVCDMQLAGDKNVLIQKLWGNHESYTILLGGLREENPVLSVLITGSTGNTYYPTEERRAHHLFREGLQLEGVLANMVRMRSQHLVPFSTAAYSILAERDKIPRHFSVPLTASHRGALMGQTWIDDFLPLAVAARGLQAHSETIKGVEACSFDNFSM